LYFWHTNKTSVEFGCCKTGLNMWCYLVDYEIYHREILKLFRWNLLVWSYFFQ